MKCPHCDHALTLSEVFVDNQPLTPDELAVRWRMHKGTLSRWRTEGVGPGYMRISSGHVLYRVADVEAYEASVFRQGENDYG